MDEVPFDLLQPHVILPAQYFHPPRKLSAEHRLMMAVLEDAVRCVASFRAPTADRDHQIFADAKHWLLVEEPHWPYSFEHICAALDIDADAVREELRLAPGCPPVSDSRGAGTRKRQSAVSWG